MRRGARRTAIPRLAYTKRFLDRVLNSLEVGNDTFYLALMPKAYREKDPPVEVIVQTARGAYHTMMDPRAIRSAGWKWAGRSIGAVHCMGYKLAFRRTREIKKASWGYASSPEWVFVKANDAAPIRRANVMADIWNWMKGETVHE